MEHYKNIGGDSGVAAYEIGQGSITVQFKDGAPTSTTIRAQELPILRKCSVLRQWGRVLTVLLAVRFVKAMHKSCISLGSLSRPNPAFVKGCAKACSLLTLRCMLSRN